MKDFTELQLIATSYNGGNKPLLIKYEEAMDARGAYIEKDGEVIYDGNIDVVKIYEVTPNYLDYINSDEWERRKQKYFSTNERKCYMCGSTKGIQLHHLSYKNLGNETDYDLEPLCVDCHHRVHAFVDGLKDLIDVIKQGHQTIKNEFEEKMRFELKRRTANYIERKMSRIKEAAEVLPPVIAGHKPHIATILKQTLFVDDCTMGSGLGYEMFIKLLKSKVK